MTSRAAASSLSPVSSARSSSSCAYDAVAIMCHWRPLGAGNHAGSVVSGNIPPPPLTSIVIVSGQRSRASRSADSSASKASTCCSAARSRSDALATFLVTAGGGAISCGVKTFASYPSGIYPQEIIHMCLASPLDDGQLDSGRAASDDGKDWAAARQGRVLCYAALAAEAERRLPSSEVRAKGTARRIIQPLD